MFPTPSFVCTAYYPYLDPCGRTHILHTWIHMAAHTSPTPGSIWPHAHLPYLDPCGRSHVCRGGTCHVKARGRRSRERPCGRHNTRAPPPRSLDARGRQAPRRGMDARMQRGSCCCCTCSGRSAPPDTSAPAALDHERGALAVVWCGGRSVGSV